MFPFFSSCQRGESTAYSGLHSAGTQWLGPGIHLTVRSDAIHSVQYKRPNKVLCRAVGIPAKPSQSPRAEASCSETPRTHRTRTRALHHIMCRKGFLQHPVPSRTITGMKQMDHMLATTSCGWRSFSGRCSFLYTQLVATGYQVQPLPTRRIQ